MTTIFLKWNKSSTKSMLDYIEKKLVAKHHV